MDGVIIACVCVYCCVYCLVDYVIASRSIALHRCEGEQGSAPAPLLLGPTQLTITPNHIIPPLHPVNVSLYSALCSMLTHCSLHSTIPSSSCIFFP